MLLEVANMLSGSPRGRDRFTALLDRINLSPAAIVIAASHESFAEGVELYRQRRDKVWSLTDCISFAVMRQHGLTRAPTSDHHFEQAGFSIILRS